MDHNHADNSLLELEEKEIHFSDDKQVFKTLSIIEVMDDNIKKFMMINEDSVIVFDSEMKEIHRTKGLGEIKVA